MYAPKEPSMNGTAVLGHTDRNQIKAMERSVCVDGMKIVEHPKRDFVGCGDCQAGKGKSSSHAESTPSRATQILERVHMDLFGPINPPSSGGSSYFLLIKDEYSSYLFSEFIASKSEVPAKLKDFVTRISATRDRSSTTKLLNLCVE